MFKQNIKYIRNKFKKIFGKSPWPYGKKIRFDSGTLERAFVGIKYLYLHFTQLTARDFLL